MSDAWMSQDEIHHIEGLADLYLAVHAVIVSRLIVAGRTFSCGPHCTPDTQLTRDE